MSVAVLSATLGPSATIMSFSGALTLTDLNDFITPSQACIKPVEEVKSVERVQEPGAAAVSLEPALANRCIGHSTIFSRRRYISTRPADTMKSGTPRAQNYRRPRSA